MGDFLTVQEFARRLGVEEATVYIAIKQDRVQHTRILGRLGIPKTELRRFKRRRNGVETKIFKRANGYK
jgi:excisionase family DNA binding protein